MRNDDLDRLVSDGGVVYAYDVAMSETRTDAYGYNARNELISATKLGGPASVPATPDYAYQYDDIGNRITSTDLTTNRTYTANSLNQYSAITTSDFGLQTSSFEPLFDDDGNQTLIQTSTGIWQVQYNGENRPVLWTGGTQSAATNIVMSFDRMGRRVEYIETSGTVTNTCLCFVYDNYVCVAQVKYNPGMVFALDCYLWDPVEWIYTRPLVLLESNLSPKYYTHDANKHMSDIISPSGVLTSHYEYAPFGTLTNGGSEEAITNPFGYSSERSDGVIGLIYYNYRHYDFSHGAWMSRDVASEISFDRDILLDYACPTEVLSIELSLYRFVFNSPIDFADFLGCLYPGQGRIGPPLSLPNRLEGSGSDRLELDYISNSKRDPNGYEKLARRDHFWNLRPYRNLNSSSDFKPNDVLENSRQCISSLLVISHGSYVTRAINGGGKKIVGVHTIWGRTDLRETEGRTEISDMFKNIKFCSKCKLELRACVLGSSDILRKRLEKNTGCTVVLFETEVNPYGEPIVKSGK